MSMNEDQKYLNSWWAGKLSQSYGVQWKHIAAARLLTDESFPLIDLGAGSGVFLKLVEERFPNKEMAGVEISDTAISNKVCNSVIVQGDVARWSPDEKVKTISLIDVIEHVPDPEPLIRHAAEMADYVLIACPNFNFIQARLDALCGKVPFQNRVGRGGHVYWCEHETLNTVFNRNNLSVAETNHLYPRNDFKVLRSVLSARPSVFAHEFVFLLKSSCNE